MKRPTLEKLEQNFYDVIVIGAGATGCAATKELSRRGYSVLLLDRSDIGSGTSSRSSRLLYCGLGYMKPPYPLWKIPFHPVDMLARIYRAWLTMRCRTELAREMPDHLALKKFYFPYGPHSSQKYPALLIDFGFRLLSLFGSKDVPLGYSRIDFEQAKENSGLVAALFPDVESVGSFYEYQYAWPERICVDTALEAEFNGATIRTYTEVTSLEYSDGAWHLNIEDTAPESNGTGHISARMIINAAGPWVDQVLKNANPVHKYREVLGVKGVNLMVKLPDSFRDQGLEAFSSRGEPFYIFPWGDLHFIGPTETRVNIDPSDVYVSEEEIAYLLGEANSLFPGLHLKAEDVIHSWCGVRPSSTRDGHTLSGTIQLNERPETPNLVSVTGVMIMLHRHAGRLVAKAVQRRLGKATGNSRGASTHKHYNKPDFHAISNFQIEHIAKHEHVVSLSDLMRRRLPYGWEPDLGLSRIDKISRVAAAALGWSENRRKSECIKYEKEAHDHFLNKNITH